MTVQSGLHPKATGILFGNAGANKPQENTFDETPDDSPFWLLDRLGGFKNPDWEKIQKNQRLVSPSPSVVS